MDGAQPNFMRCKEGRSRGVQGGKAKSVGGGVSECRAYSPGTHARKDEDGILLESPCNPTRTRSV
jgi:hypothetical protein